jgi:hypothetical protein
MYRMFFRYIGIPFQGSQSLSNMRSILTHSGVNDTDVQCAAESDFCIKTVFLIIREKIRQSWLRRSVNDTAVVCTQRYH